MPPDIPIIPFHTYLWKVASRCNINCTYCYVYNLADSRWRNQPTLMSADVARRTARRMREHLERHGKREASIIFHGGEPLLGGLSHLGNLTRIIGETFGDSNIKLSVGMQSNLLLFTPEIGSYMRDVGMTIGVSLDGPPRVNDVFRLDHRGRSTSAQLEDRLAILCSTDFRDIFSGFLCVINPDTDPVEVTEYLLGFDPPGIDYLFPLNNHDVLPLSKRSNPEESPYGQWLVQAYDYWVARRNETKIRIFTSIIRMLCGRPSEVESIGLWPADLVVVETNGDLEAVDSLKSTYDGATALGFNILDHDFDSVARDLRVRSRQVGAESLCPKCQECHLVHVCGGGYLPHRYSNDRGFNNPSVYCSDLMQLIHHIHDSLECQVTALRTQTEVAL